MSTSPTFGDGDRRDIVPFDRRRFVPARNGEAQLLVPGSASLAISWNVLMKRCWTVAAVALVVTGVVAIVSFLAPPVYKATARIEVQPESPLTQAILETNERPDTDDGFLQTQIQVLRSDRLASQTIEQLQLSRRGALVRPGRLAGIGPEQQKFLLISRFRENLTVEVVPKTRVLLVAYEARDPKLAADVAAALVNNHLEHTFSQRSEFTRQAAEWMQQQLAEVKGKVELSQAALVEYESRHQIANTSEKQNVAEQMLSDLSRALTSAQEERIQKESLIQQVLADQGRIAWLAHDDLLQKLEEKGAELQGLHTEAVAQYGPKFPKALRLEQEVRDNQAQVEREQGRVIERIRRDYDSAVRREKLAAAAVARQKEAVASLNQLLVERNILERDFESNQQLYRNLLQRLKNATVAAGLRSTSIHLLDNALPPDRTVRPKRALNIMLGLFAGVVLGMIAAFAQESIDPSINTAEEVENLLPNPLLAAIPLDRSPQLRMLGRRRSQRIAEHSLALSVKQRPKSRLSEAYRMLGTSVLLPPSLSSAASTPKTVLVTSPHAGEGKTLTTVNLALALAQRRGPVLMVDCDLRNGSIARALGISNEKELANLLTGEAYLDDVLAPCAQEPRLWVLPAGPITANPAELLAGESMLTLLGTLASRFERVVIDSPPVLAVTDATILSSMVEGVILVAESGGTPRAALLRSHRMLKNAGARILGVALNKFDPRRHGYYGTVWMPPDGPAQRTDAPDSRAPVQS